VAGEEEVTPVPGRPVRLLMVLSENHAIVPPRDLRGLVDLAVQAEAAGVDGVMPAVARPPGRAADRLLVPR
jgi:hypothetical protein